MKQGEVRIIGGNWRSRKLKFPAIAGLRPTPDRVRETVFNWLTPVIQGAYCLDLFSGSGALGFEALSRGAAHTLFVDQASAIINYLQQQIKILKTEQANVCLAHVPFDKLPSKFISRSFDIIFLDPPFNKDLIKPTCDWLIKQNLIAAEAYIYIEAESTLAPLPVPMNWEMLKTKKSGQVGYHLFQHK